MQKMMTEGRRRVFNILALAAGIVVFFPACVSKTDVPVREGYFYEHANATQHVVREGETLYSIAWFFRKDFKSLAVINGIRPPYVIYPGQVIYLQPKARNKKKHKPPIAQPGTPKNNLANNEKKRSTKKYARQNVAENPRWAKNDQKIRWAWPYDGAILSRYSSARGRGIAAQGLDISGKAGDAVKAAANGIVVYSGNGLVGYGNLIIIKHNEIYLSAYAHNARLSVREGEKVKVGQKIAEIGSSGTNRNKLHFEIRREGTPVDPLLFLPKRS